MKRYLRLVLYFLRYGIIASLEFRVNFISWAFVSLFWSFMFILGTELIFGQVTTLAGWTKNEVLLTTSFLTLFVGAMWVFIFPNLVEFSRLIREGGLDFYLVKPVNDRFFVSTKNVEYDQILRIVAVSIFVINLLSNMNVRILPINLFGSVVLFVAGMIIFYNIFFSLAITNFWLVNVHNLEDFFHSILDIGRYPVQVYKGVFSILFVYLIPVGYVATFPVQALLGKLDPVYYLWAILLIFVTSIFSQWFWNFALKRYSSASS